MERKWEIFFKLNCTALKLIMLLRFVSVFSRMCVVYTMPRHKRFATLLSWSLCVSCPLQVSFYIIFRLAYMHACMHSPAFIINGTTLQRTNGVCMHLVCVASYRLCKSADPVIYAITAPCAVKETKRLEEQWNGDD